MLQGCLLTGFQQCHFLLFIHDYVRSWVASLSRRGGRDRRPGPAAPRCLGRGRGRHGLGEALPGGLTFCRSVCSCFSITSSWYTLPVRSKGCSSLERQRTKSGPSHLWGSGEAQGVWRRSSGGSQKLALPAMLHPARTPVCVDGVVGAPGPATAGHVPALKCAFPGGRAACAEGQTAPMCDPHVARDDPSRRHPRSP